MAMIEKLLLEIENQGIKILDNLARIYEEPVHPSHIEYIMQVKFPSRKKREDIETRLQNFCDNLSNQIRSDSELKRLEEYILSKSIWIKGLYGEKEQKEEIRRLRMCRGNHEFHNILVNCFKNNLNLWINFPTPNRHFYETINILVDKGIKLKTAKIKEVGPLDRVIITDFKKKFGENWEYELLMENAKEAREKGYKNLSEY